MNNHDKIRGLHQINQSHLPVEQMVAELQVRAFGHLGVGRVIDVGVMIVSPRFIPKLKCCYFRDKL